MKTKQTTYEYFNALGYPIEGALQFAIKIHEVDQQQERKGKDIPYIVHPLTVGLILARVGASENVIAAGILHDTIEDSIADKKVTSEMLAKKFGKAVADIVASVTEPHKDLPWEARKKEALERIKTYSHDSLLVKSADVISNASEIIADYDKDGEQIFARFNAPKERILRHYLETITAIRDRWEGNPLVWTLRRLADDLQSRVAGGCFMLSHPAKIIEYADYDENALLECPVCRWKGTAQGNIEYYDDLLDVSCSNCGKMLLVVSYPHINNKKQS